MSKRLASRHEESPVKIAPETTMNLIPVERPSPTLSERKQMTLSASNAFSVSKQLNPSAQMSVEKQYEKEVKFLG